MNKFVVNFFSILSTKVLNLALAFIISILIARYLGPQGQGQYALVLLIPGTLFILGNMGIGKSAVYYLNTDLENREKILFTTLVSTLSISLILIFLSSIVIYLLRDTFFGGINFNYLLLALVMLPVFFLVNVSTDILIAVNEIKKHNIYSILRNVVFLCLILAFLIFSEFEVLYALIGFALALIIEFILNLNVINKKYLRGYYQFDLKYLKKGLNYGYKIYLSNIFIFLHYKFDILLINFFLSPLYVGLYSVPVHLIEKIWLVSVSAGAILFPKISLETEESKKNYITQNVFKSIFLISLIIAIIFYVLSDLLIIKFYTVKYQESIEPLKILLIGSLAISGWRIIANDFFGRGKAAINAILAGISLILNVILNVILIPRYNIIGAAWATTITYSLVLIMSLIVYSRSNKIPIHRLLVVNKNDILLYKKFTREFFIKFKQLISFK